MERPYDLSSMTALICFEAAARHISFKLAAREINVTPAAVSHQIKALEDDLGCTLFNRKHRGVELTEKGAYLFVALQRGFEIVSGAVTELRERPQAVDVTIRATTAVSALWLTPKITAFWKSHPTITVAQSVSDVEHPGGRYDLSIGYTLGPVGDDEYHMLFRDRIFAFGTRKFLEQFNIESSADLLHAPLIHLSNDENAWTGWKDWLGALGQPAPQGRSFFVNNHMIALQTAEDDVGAVLGWEGLMGGLMRQKRLVTLVPDSIPSSVPFCLRIKPRASNKARVFANWLLENAL